MPTSEWRIRQNWVRCDQCVSAWKAEREIDREWLGKSVATDAGRVELGWNGVPSDRSLRRRAR